MGDPPPASSLSLGDPDEQPVKMPQCSPFNVEGAWEGSLEKTSHIRMAKIKSCSRGWKKPPEVELDYADTNWFSLGKMKCQ